MVSQKPWKVFPKPSKVFSEPCRVSRKPWRVFSKPGGKRLGRSRRCLDGDGKSVHRGRTGFGSSKRRCGELRMAGNRPGEGVSFFVEYRNFFPEYNNSATEYGNFFVEYKYSGEKFRAKKASGGISIQFPVLLIQRPPARHPCHLRRSGIPGKSSPKCFRQRSRPLGRTTNSACRTADSFCPAAKPDCRTAK